MTDPDIQAAREICASTYEAQHDFLDEKHRKDWANFMRQGDYDDERVFITALAGIKHGRENPTDPLQSIAQSLKLIAESLGGDSPFLAALHGTLADASHDHAQRMS